MPAPDITAATDHATTTDRSWSEMDSDRVATRLGVDPALGLEPNRAARLLAEVGPNRLAEPPRRSSWLVFLDQFRNLLIIVLMAAAVLAGLVGDLKDMAVIGVVLILNAVLGFVQEHRAERSLAALRGMLVATAKVRRGGSVTELPAEELVPGDVVLLEAGGRVPADGRIVASASLEIDESALTGESTPVAKSSVAAPAGAPLGERTSMAHMNTVVTRGRGELVVTATGMATEMGALAELLQAAHNAPTPLQEQLAVLGERLAAVGGAAVAVFFLLGLARGESVADTLLAAVALAVAAIPEGLPAVVTVTLAVGVHQMAKRGAIVKRLASVETLGSTTVICSDKTGTLTLNQMTARAVVIGDTVYRVTGEGYAGEGDILGPGDTHGEAAVVPLARLALACNDSRVVEAAAMGDPTEAALVTLAAKAGVARESLDRQWPRLAEVPFDSARKFMATFHGDASGGVVVAVKGGADVLLARCLTVLGPNGPVALDSARRQAIDADIDALAAEGLRVLAVAERRLAPHSLDSARSEGDLVDLADDLTLVGLVGLLDPPRREARDAIALCRRAGIAVKMITGDHAATATAIAAQLGLHGATLTGTELDRLGDDELAGVVEETAVFARVAPEHKVRLVEALRANGHVVAMTGDGVNDAPALKSADIGVAMGITGTEVSKEAAAMVLTDDNFATIVRAVEAGRSIYDNIVKFVRFQLSTNIGAILSLIGAQLAGLPVPFTALQVLWVNIIMDGPPAMALGVDPPAAGTMERQPRARGAAILTGRRLARMGATGAVMAAGTLGVLTFGLETGTEDHALAMAFTTFVLFQIFNALCARSETASVFSRDTLRNGKLWAALIVVVALQAAAVHVDPVQDIFGTVDFTLWDWVLTTAVASTVMWFDEARKAMARRG
ncbi:MAG: Lead, cadmium, zinc and mercury transporting ATPase; Copper-translocating P-type ATPase [uncultured Acidimicrobiales bacterium]|uniref:Lead, cadmium, zinc and mercury transporting ATPase Copper-translocating P-type ATPase n=1 Tax=uncultured Acidimicrobiales bacterium TaxID=310071 RepID=A0A6J4J2T8_9ACTN|nr:MAG: Lead, cadmium, zinc and mercury transporting ATPase; Copper-translocating P-type ATPase [uncultured Acidimicrobiales bacterium]